MKDLYVSLLGDIYGNLLTDKQRNIVRDYYDRDLSLSEIAEAHGITRQAALDAVRTGENTLKKYESALGFAEKFRRISEYVSEIEKLLGNGDCSGAEAATKELEALLI